MYKRQGLLHRENGLGLTLSFENALLFDGIGTEDGGFLFALGGGDGGLLLTCLLYTSKGLPDISLLEPLAAALGVSVLELMQGEPIINRNQMCIRDRGSTLTPVSIEELFVLMVKGENVR